MNVEVSPIAQGRTFASQNLVVNPRSDTVHRKTCGSVRRLSLHMFTLPAKLFLSIGAQRDYSTERGWHGCRTCKPFGTWTTAPANTVFYEIEDDDDD